MSSSVASVIDTAPETRRTPIRRLASKEATMTLTMPIHDTDTSPLLTAVTYQRVSTKEQATKGGS
ncbi:MAG: hypothetical protein ACTH7X_05165 [Brevibacterium aurantiacum]